MTIPYCIQVGQNLNQAQISQIESLITETFSAIHQTYNNWNPHSEISRLNSSDAFQKIAVSQGLFDFLKRADFFVHMTEGKFDPTVDPLQKLWKASLAEGKLPPEEKLEALSPAIGWTHIHLEEGYFWKDHPLTSMDLSAMAKGYAVDLLLETLNKNGYTSAYVEWGGEIAVSGFHPEGRPWEIGIYGLFSLPLTDCAIATSGNYLQNWQVAGKSYTHIIDPHTKQPLQSKIISSASIVASTCVEADALTTALMLFPSQEAALAWACENKIQAYLW